MNLVPRVTFSPYPTHAVSLVLRPGYQADIHTCPINWRGTRKYFVNLQLKEHKFLLEYHRVIYHVSFTQWTRIIAAEDRSESDCCFGSTVG